ncbi:MAG: hypothetical protein M1827_000693 [Pycnora praestabilis]|nr:MAG: hypothetical protein M1827_000693 [Pycnora praestabilis]
MPKGLKPSDSPGIQIRNRKQETPKRLQPLSRSPHPYYRRKFEPPSSAEHDVHVLNGDDNSAVLSPSPPQIPSGADYDEAEHDDDGRMRRGLTKSPSDSGTEADDESFSYLKGLPAPPSKPRKGLKDTYDFTIEGTPSPLLTPSFLDGDNRRLSLGYKPGGREDTKAADEAEGQRIEAEKRYEARRRAELIRRTTEVSLLGSIGLVVFSGSLVLEAAREWHRAELLTYGMVALVLFTLYPLRLLFSREATPNAKRSGLFSRIQLPSTFDPAPLLYPLCLPVYAALSLLPAFQTPLLPNLILSLSSLSPQLVPLVFQVNGYSSFHWFITSIPLIASKNTSLSLESRPPIPNLLKTSPPATLDPELLMCLYPLHRALIPPLEYLTTTSLLPAELQLLSISLINILLLSTSPQATILKAMLWGGGVSVFVLCNTVLKSGVALARVPRWRFRHAEQIRKAKEGTWGSVDGTLMRRTSGMSFLWGSDDQTQSDGNKEEAPVTEQSRKNIHLTLDIRNCNGNVASMKHDQETKSAIVQGQKQDFSKQNGSTSVVTHQKRYSLSTNDTSSLRQELRTTSSGRRKRSKSFSTQSFLNLTPGEATVRKWVYAAYVYTAITFIAFAGIRSYVGQWALGGNEPVGWALGYLFGNIQPLRFLVVKWNMERWICLPVRDAVTDGSPDDANMRLLICGYCLVVLAIGMAIVLRLSSVVEVDTRRKVFHGMMVAMFLPTVYIDPTFTGLALELVLAIFLLLDLFRASQLPPLSKPLAYFLTPYVDGRDLRGPVVVSHIFLLIGCAIPLWLSLAGTERAGDGAFIGWGVASRDVSMVSGVICVGMGDAAASLVGRRFGRHKWLWSGGKSLEGSFAFIVAVTLGLVCATEWLRILPLPYGNLGKGWVFTLLKSMGAATGASLTEAVLTGGNDNVVVPVVLWLLVRGLEL